MVVMVINTFVKELKSGDAKMRALALRHLSQLRGQYDQVKQYLVESLKDHDVAVKRVAIMGCLRVQRSQPDFF